MTWDEYREQVKRDALEVLESDWQDGRMHCIDTDEKTIEAPYLSDDLFCDDDVTGNGSGSYTFNRSVAVENVSGVIWSDEFGEAIQEWDINMAELFDKGPEAVDVVIRCYILGEVCRDVAHEWAKAHGYTVI